MTDQIKTTILAELNERVDVLRRSLRDPVKVNKAKAEKAFTDLFELLPNKISRPAKVQWVDGPQQLQALYQELGASRVFQRPQDTYTVSWEVEDDVSTQIGTGDTINVSFSIYFDSDSDSESILDRTGTLTRNLTNLIRNCLADEEQGSASQSATAVANHLNSVFFGLDAGLIVTLYPLVMTPLMIAESGLTEESEMIRLLRVLYDAGVWGYMYSNDHLLVLTRPKCYFENNQLHHSNGAAVTWKNGETYYFWKGVRVPANFLRNRDKLTASGLRKIRNTEQRRCFIEIIGYEKFLGGAKPISEDEYGKLYDLRIGADGGDDDGEPFNMRVVEVINGTPEPDGSHKLYYLTVPPTIRSAHEGVAWSYGLSKDQYGPEKRT